MRYINLEVSGTNVRVYRRGEYIDTAVGAILDAWARREHGPRAMVYSYRRDTWNNEGTTYSVSVVERPDRRFKREQGYSVLASAQVHLYRDDVQHAADYLDTHRAF